MAVDDRGTCRTSPVPSRCERMVGAEHQHHNFEGKSKLISERSGHNKEGVSTMHQEDYCWIDHQLDFDRNQDRYMRLLRAMMRRCKMTRCDADDQ